MNYGNIQDVRNLAVKCVNIAKVMSYGVDVKNFMKLQNGDYYKISIKKIRGETPESEATDA